MTTVAVLADPPRSGAVLTELATTSPLDESEAADVYAAMLTDVCRAVERSGADLLVNYRPSEQVAADVDDVEAELRAGLDAELADDPRYEVQVGSTFAGRVGNTVTHLLDSEGVQTAAVVEPTAAFLDRSAVDGAAMKLRSNEVVLGPASGGRVYYAGFAAPVDFDDAFALPAIETLTGRGRDAGHDVDFLSHRPVVETGDDLVTALATVRARQRADRPVPERTAAALDDLGLTLVERDGELTLSR